MGGMSQCFLMGGGHGANTRGIMDLFFKTFNMCVLEKIPNLIYKIFIKEGNHRKPEAYFYNEVTVLPGMEPEFAPVIL